MQANDSGFFVHIHHDFGAFEHGVELRLDDAQKFLSELGAAVANCERTHVEKGEHAVPAAEETKAEAKAEEAPKPKRAAKKPAKKLAVKK